MDFLLIFLFSLLDWPIFLIGLAYFFAGAAPPPGPAGFQTGYQQQAVYAQRSSDLWEFSLSNHFRPVLRVDAASALDCSNQ